MKRIIKKVFIMFIVFVLSFSIVACSSDEGETNQNLPTIAFEKVEVELYVGDTYTLDPSITELSGVDLVDYKILDEAIISINGTTITALKAGTTKVVASLKGYEDIKAEVSINVLEKQVERVKAKLDEKYQGAYFANNISVTVEESKITITEGGNILSFDLYDDGGKVYILDSVDNVDVKIYISFSSDGNTITAEGKGSFTKKEVLVAGEIPPIYKGTYFSKDTIIETTINTLKIVNVVNGQVDIYEVYTADGSLFIMVNENKEYFSFENNFLTIFNKRYPKSEYTLDNQAKLDASKIGDYTQDTGRKITLTESTISYSFGTSSIKQAILYEDAYGIYFYDVNSSETRKAYLNFDTNSVNLFGYIYLKDGSDKFANIDSIKTGDYYNGRSTISIYSNLGYLPSSNGGMDSFNLFANSQGIYYIDKDGSNQYITITDYSVTVKDVTYYKKATTSESVRDFYNNETNTLYISENELMYFVTTNNKRTYTLLQEQNGLCYFDDNITKQSITFTDLGLVCGFGTFIKRSNLGDHDANIPEELQGEYTGNGVRYVVYGNGTYIYKDGASTYSYCRLSENAIGIYYYDSETRANIYCKFEDNKIINVFGTFEKPSIGEIVEIEVDKRGQYLSNSCGMVIASNKVYLFEGSNVSQMYLHQYGNGYCIFANNNINDKPLKIVFNADGSMTFNEQNYIKTNISSQYSHSYVRLLDEQKGMYVCDYFIASLFGINIMFRFEEGVTKGSNVMAEIVNDDVKYYCEIYNSSTGRNDKEYLVFGDNNLVIGEETLQKLETKDELKANLPIEKQGDWYIKQDKYEFKANSLVITNVSGNVKEYDLYCVEGIYYYLDNNIIKVVLFEDDKVIITTNENLTTMELSNEPTFVSSLPTFPSDMVKTIIDLDLDLSIECASEEVLFDGFYVEKNGVKDFRLSITNSTQEDADKYALKLIDLGFDKVDDTRYRYCGENAYYVVEINSFYFIIYHKYEYSGGDYNTWKSEFVDPEIPEAHGQKYVFALTSPYSGYIKVVGMNLANKQAYEEALVANGFVYEEAMGYYKQNINRVSKTVYISLTYSEFEGRLQINVTCEDYTRDILGELGELFTIRFIDGFTYNKVLSRNNDNIVIEIYDGDNLSQIVKFVKVATTREGVNLYHEFDWYDGYGWSYSNLVDESVVMNNLNVPLQGDVYLSYWTNTLIGKEEVNGTLCEHYRYINNDTSVDTWVGYENRYLYKIAQTESGVTRVLEELLGINKASADISDFTRDSLLYSAWSSDAVTNIFGADLLSAFGEENSKYFFKDNAIWAFNVSREHYESYRSEKCGEGNKFQITYHGNIFDIYLSYETVQNSGIEPIGLMKLNIQVNEFVFPDDNLIDLYGYIFPNYKGNGYFEVSEAGSKYLLYEATQNDINDYQDLLTQNGWVYDEVGAAYKRTVNGQNVYLLIVSSSDCYRFVIQTE